MCVSSPLLTHPSIVSRFISHLKATQRMKVITLIRSSLFLFMIHYIRTTNPLPVVTSDVLAELQHCSGKSSTAVNECRDQYTSDVNQFGRKGPPCCAYSKLVYCLNESLVKPCDKYVDRLLGLFQADEPKDCEGIEYPSVSCLITVKSNLIFGTAITALVLCIICIIYYCCKCICKCSSCCRSKWEDEIKGGSKPRREELFKVWMTHQTSISSEKKTKESRERAVMVFSIPVGVKRTVGQKKLKWTKIQLQWSEGGSREKTIKPKKKKKCLKIKSSIIFSFSFASFFSRHLLRRFRLLILILTFPLYFQYSLSLFTIDLFYSCWFPSFLFRPWNQYPK